MIKITNSRILVGDCVARMNMLEKESIDHIITDPPYEINFMNSGWDNSGVAYNPKTWKAAHRVLKPNGVMLVFGATRTHHRIADAIKRAGFEIVDIIAWTYGTGFPKSHNISKAIDKMPKADLYKFSKALKERRIELGYSMSQADMLITGGTSMYSFFEGRTNKPLYAPNETHWKNIQEHFGMVGWENIVKNNLIQVGVGEGNYGYQKSGERWDKKTIINQTTTTHAEKWQAWGTALKPAWEPIIVARKIGNNFTMTDSYSPFHYIPKAGKKERNRGLNDFEDKKKYNDFGLKNRIENGETTNSRTNKEASHTKNDHPTVKPVNLMKELILDFTKEGETILDAFMGSGSTGIACVLTNRRFVGIELTPEYIPLAKARIKYAEEKPDEWI